MALTKIPANLLDTSANLDFADNERLRIGTDSDLQIYHASANGRNYFSGGDIEISTNSFRLFNLAGTTGMITATPGGAVTLYHSNSAKVATSSTGATVTGNLTVTGDLNITGDVNSASVTDLDVVDKTITLGKGQVESASGGSGIVIDGSNASMLWDETNGEFDFNNPLSIVNSVADDTVLNLTANYSANGNAALLGFARVGGAVSGDIRYVDSDTSMEIGTNTAHSFAIKTGTTRRFSINSSGLVGIGTTSPGYDFEVRTNDTSTEPQQVIRQIGAGDAALGFQIPSANNWYIGVDNSDSDIFKIGEGLTVGTTPHLNITTAGNVGIGQTNPQAKLHVQGNIISTGVVQVFPSAAGAASVQLQRQSQGTAWSLAQGNSSVDMFEILRGSSSYLAVNSGGAIGIGTASPQYKFDVYGTSDVTMRVHRPSSGLSVNDTCGIGFSQRGDTTTSSTDTRAGIFSTYNGNLFLATEPGGNLNTNPVDHAALSITGTAQNIGIGTISPSSKLHVVATNNSAGDLYTAVGPGNCPSITIQNAGTTDNNNAALYFRDDSDMRASIGARFTNHSNNSAQLRFSTSDASGNTRERVIINEGGQITQPYMPAFRAYTSTEWTTVGRVNSGWTDGTNYRSFDIGGNFNTSNGRFTAPVAGVYFFQLMWDANNTISVVDFEVNHTAQVRWEPTGIGDAAWESHYYATQLKLQANDYVTIYLRSFSGTPSYPMHMGGGTWGGFSGYLIG